MTGKARGKEEEDVLYLNIRRPRYFTNVVRLRF